MKNNWKPVVEDLIVCLLKNGLILHSVDNGDDEEIIVTTVDKAVEEITAVDEAHLYMRNPEGAMRWIYIVLGNEPWETMSDYTCDPLIDKASDEFFTMWEGRSVPKIKEDWVARFKSLALGTKFSYMEDPSKVFVKLSNSGGIVQWDNDNIDTNWIGQPAFQFDDDKDFDQKVIVRESRD